jgi:hypothetical protein
LDDLADDNCSARETTARARDELHRCLHVPRMHQDGDSVRMFIGRQDERKSLTGEKPQQGFRRGQSLLRELGLGARL